MTMGDDGLMHSYHYRQKGDEARNWDFAAQRKQTHLCTVLEGAGNLVKSCLGGGVVAIHVAYMTVGLWTAFVLNIVLGYIVSYMMIVLARCAQKVYGRVQQPVMSYADLAEACCDISSLKCIRTRSRVLRYLVDATIMIDLFGACCCYQILIAAQVDQLLRTYLNVVWNTRFIVFLLWIPCVALCMILHLKYLAWCSLAADVVLVAVAITTAVKGTMSAISANRKLTSMPVFTSVGSLFQYIGVCVFSMEGVGVTLPIENSLAQPKKIGLVLSLGMSIVVAIVMIVGFFGNWGYDKACTSPITTNFGMDAWSLILKIALPIMVYVTFALNFWVPFRLVWAYFIDKYKKRPELAERICRAIIVTIITIISIAFPAVNQLMGLIGAFCLSNMGFLYPAFMDLIVDYEDPGLGAFKWRLWKFIAIFIFSIILMIAGTFFNVVAMLRQLGVNI